MTSGTDTAKADARAAPAPTANQVAATMRSRQYVALLVISAVVGIVVSLATWCFLELVHQLDRELYTHLPNALGYHGGPPLWWSLPVLAVAGFVVALAITKLPGDGGHLPARGLAAGGSVSPVNLPGVILAGLATIGSGLVLGPEAPVIALGAGVAVLAIRLARRDTPEQVRAVVAAAGAFAAISFIFESPLIGAVILVEAAAIGGPRLPLVLLPGLLAAGIGSLVSIGMGSFTGLSSSAYALSPVVLPHFGHPDIAQLGWTIALAVAVAAVARVLMLGGLLTHRIVTRSTLLLLPIVGLLVAGLAIAFHGAADKSVNEVLFSGESALPGLVSQAGTWSLSALALLIGFKGLAYGLSLGSFRGGPTFPALFLGAAAGIMASRLPGFALTPAVAVGIGAATTAVLRLPLSAIVLATLLTAKTGGTGEEPLIIVGAVAAYLVTLLFPAELPTEGADAERTAEDPTGDAVGDVAAHPSPATSA